MIQLSRATPVLFSALLLALVSAARAAETGGWTCANAAWALQQEFPAGLPAGNHHYFALRSVGGIQLDFVASAVQDPLTGDESYAGTNAAADTFALTVTNLRTERDAGYRRQVAAGSLAVKLARPYGEEPGEGDTEASGPEMKVSVDCHRDLDP